LGDVSGRVRAKKRFGKAGERPCTSVKRLTSSNDKEKGIFARLQTRRFLPEENGTNEQPFHLSQNKGGGRDAHSVKERHRCNEIRKKDSGSDMPFILVKGEGLVEK